MPRVLENRLNAVLDDTPAARVNAHHATWNNHLQFGQPIADVRTFVVHETSGLPARVTQNTFDPKFYSATAYVDAAGPHASGEMTQLLVTGDGTVFLGMDLPLKTHHANFVNAWALGSETAHSWGNYGGNDHLGPYTSTDETRDADGKPVRPPFGQLVPLTAKPGNGWIPLSGDRSMAVDDVPGVKIWIRDISSEVVVSWWTTERYAGPWRQPQRVPEMLFTEWHYRSWALLARYIAERFSVPRNFPLLPHKMRSPGFGTAGSHGMINDAQSFLSIVRADEILFRSPGMFTTVGITNAQFAVDAQLMAGYRRGVQNVGAGANQWSRNRVWTKVFDKYRGFHGHGFSGDPDGNQDHDCPGPMFDWHRFAREVWDWWWHPFDFDAAHAHTNVDRRAYCRPERNGDTHLLEHFFSTAPAFYTAREAPGIHGATGSPRTYRLEQASPVYALANGELVAARFPPEDAAHVSLAFIVVRHEVFHRPDPAGAAADLAAGVAEWFGGDHAPPMAGRIDYDADPSSVYTLYMHLGRPPGMSFDDVNDANPDWLNRLLTRKKEVHLGTQFHTDHAAQIPDAAWNSRPPGSVVRPTVLEGWTTDEANYQPTLDRLRRGEMSLMPRNDPFATPIRILLGDFLGHSGIIRRDAAGTQYGVRVEVFSREVISTDFTSVALAAGTTGWNPPAAPVPGTGGPAIRYQSEWARTPEGAEKAALEAAGVPTDLMGWWSTLELGTQLGRNLPADSPLENGGWAVHYDPALFMNWINQRTWHSEWPKYNLADPPDVPAAPRARS